MNVKNKDRIGESRNGWKVLACTRPYLKTVIYDVEHVCGIRQKMSLWVWQWSKTPCAQCRPSISAVTTTQYEEAGL